jgi:transposase
MKAHPFPSPDLDPFQELNALYGRLHQSEKDRLQLEHSNGQLQNEIKILREEIDLLKGYLRLRQHTIFGRKSEKLDASSTMPLLPSFEHIFDEVHEDEEEETDKAQDEGVKPQKSRKKPGRRPLPPELPREKVIYDIGSDEKVCACGHPLHKIGEETSEQLDYIPAQVKVVQNVRYKYGCKSCQETVKLAPLTPQPIPKSIATPGLLSHVLVSKYQDHLPLYRQSMIWERIGVDLQRSTMSNWVLKCGALLSPIVELFKKKIVTGDYARADETTAQVLKEPGRKAQTKSYMWVYMSGSKTNPAIVYEYHPTRNEECPGAFLSNFKGYLQSDAYQGYNAVTKQKDVIRVGCWGHCRRKFTDVLKISSGKKGKAFEAVTVIGKLYDIERLMKEEGRTPDEVKAIRLKKSKPILEAFKKWVDTQVVVTAPKTPLGKAFRYASRQWAHLIVYLEDGRLDIDNNACERAIKPFAVGRKNWLFMGNVEGAKAAANIYSIIETCKANDVNAYQYLRHVLQEIPKTSQENLASLLPWNCKLQPETSIKAEVF